MGGLVSSKSWTSVVTCPPIFLIEFLVNYVILNIIYKLFKINYLSEITFYLIIYIYNSQI